MADPTNSKLPLPKKLPMDKYQPFSPPVPPKTKPILKSVPSQTKVGDKNATKGENSKPEATKSEDAKDEAKRKQTKEDAYNSMAAEKTIKKQSSMKQLIAKLSPKKKLLFEKGDTSPTAPKKLKKGDTSPTAPKKVKDIKQPKPTKGQSPYEQWKKQPERPSSSALTIDESNIRSSIKSTSSVKSDKPLPSIESEHTESEIEYNGFDVLGAHDLEGIEHRRQVAAEKLAGWKGGKELVSPLEQSYGGEAWDPDMIGAAL